MRAGAAERLRERLRGSRAARFSFALRRLLLRRPTAAGVWGERAGTGAGGSPRHWTELAQVQAVINRRVSGDPDVNPYLHFLRTRLAGRLPVPRALTVGCGGGELERGLARLGFATEHVGVDVAPGAVAVAVEEARKEGLSSLRYAVADADALRLEAASYDVVFGVHSVHHVARLEHLFEQVARALRPDGLLYLNEFVGPSRFQWTDRQLEVVDGLLKVLPEPFRVSVVDGRVKRRARRPTVTEVIATDPSEAVRSAEILGVAAAYFEILEVRPYGGTVLQLLLEEIAGNFSRPDGEGRALLSAIADLEWSLVSAGDLPSDFATVVARPKPRAAAGT
ncbi:MAG: class I SAM-dependent methyltransferase [Thermoanaerobaculia bacterium]